MIAFFREVFYMLGKLLTMSVPRKSILTQENYSIYLKNQKKPKKSILITKVQYEDNNENQNKK